MATGGSSIKIGVSKALKAKIEKAERDDPAAYTKLMRELGRGLARAKPAEKRK
jgi:hypothetical protein